MSIIVIVGVNWGDEGKGRIVDYLAQEADAVVRYQGGNNAGHTVVNDHGTFALHLIPSGIFNPKVTNILGPGMVINIEALTQEIEELQAAGIACDNIKISERATICFPFNQMEDAWEEERLGKKAYGSTKVGIAPAYGDRYKKKGIQVGELADLERLRNRLNDLVVYKQKVAKGVYGVSDDISVDEVFNWLVDNGNKIKHMISDTSELLENLAREGKRIVFEAQLGALRDIYYGIYPFTSSSHCLAAFAPIGGGLFGYRADRIIGIMKAFSTCVGAGPFVTEMPDHEAKSLRESGNEYGAKTGRPRRIGHFDAVASAFGAKVQEATEIAITKVDCLSGLDPLLICTGYEYNGKRIDTFPLNVKLEKCTPIYEEMAGWKEEISHIREFDQLPKQAQAYILRIEQLIGRPISYVSVGEKRADMIVRKLP